MTRTAATNPAAENSTTRFMTTPCECDKDGFCERYNRRMGGRFRQICQGTDVDPGTAAAFRAAWAADAQPPRASGDPVPLILRTQQAPGDAIAMTAAVYSLHRAYPGKYITAVNSPHKAVFDGNPDVAKLSDVVLRPGATEVQMHYPAVHSCNDRGVHFMQGWCEFLSSALGVHVPLLTNRPHLYFSAPATVGNHWVVCSGVKRDFTTKAWRGYQEVVDTLRGAVRFVQVGSSADAHPKLRGTEDMVGRTDLRQLFEVVRGARGVLCGVSLLMHVAAALEKPVVVVAGGREPVQWNSYPKQHYLHTVGALPCRSYRGRVGEACWRMRTVPLNDGLPFDKDPCERPEGGYPACMNLIRPAEVVELVLRCNAQQ